MIDKHESVPAVIGRRLAEARKARGRTQAEAAKHLGCSRPTLIAIEKGERPAKPHEIVKLAAYYGRQVHEVVRPDAPMVALAPHLRSAADASTGNREALDAAIVELERFAEDYRALEIMLGAPMSVNYPAEIRIPRQVRIKDYAQDAAIRERNRLGLGDQPILALRRLLEVEVGVRVFYGSLPSTVAGMYAYVAELGYCIMINRRHPRERRRATLGHEYGHFLCDRHKPGIDCLNGGQRKPINERFAESFGLSFLMPGSSVRRRFHEIVASTQDFQVADLCRLSSFFCVSAEAMTRRLDELGLIARGSWELLIEQGFKPRRVSEDLGLAMSVAVEDEPYPERYKFLAVQAYNLAKISEGQLCRFLRCDPVRGREIVHACMNQGFLDESTGKRQVGQMLFEFSLLREDT